MHWLGIDVGGTKTAVAFGGPDGPEAEARERWATELSGDAVRDLRNLAGHIRGLAERRGLSPTELRGVGVSLPGPLDLVRGELLNPPNLPGWHRAPVRAVLEEELGVPVALENDANAAALAEWRFGAGRGASSMIYLTMSTGIGGGLVLDRKLYRGLAASAGEVGHVPVEWDGERCSCGMYGCLEAYIGGAAWIRRRAEVTPADSGVAAHAALEGRPPRPEDVVAAAGAGDAFALAEMERFNDYLVRGLAQLAFTLAPERIVLGTIVVAAGEALCLGPVRLALRERLWDAVANGMQVLPAALGDGLPDHAGLGVALDAFPPAET
jgi:glucokinase